MGVLEKLLKAISTSSETTYVKPLAEESSAPPANQAKARNLTRDGILILRWAAMADGHMQDEEYEVIRGYCKDRCGELGLTKADMGRLVDWVVQQNPDKDALYKAIQRAAESKENAKLICEHVEKLIAADDVIEESEMEAATLIRQFFEEAQSMSKTELEKAFKAGRN